MSFTEWLIKEYGERRHDRISDLAADVIKDECWPTEGTYVTYKDHLRQHQADPRAFECFKIAWARYQVQKGSN